MFTKLRQRLTPLYLFSYRTVAFITIAGGLVFMLGWVWIMMFFMFNTSWIAPTVVSPTSDKMLQFTAGFQTAQQNYSTLSVTEHQAERDYEYALKNVASLEDLTNHMQSYVGKTIQLSMMKRQNLAASYGLMIDLDKLNRDTIANMKAGLITKDEATQTLTYIQQFKSLTEDSHIQLGTTEMTADAQSLQLAQQLQLAKNDVKLKEETLAASKIALNGAAQEMKVLKESAYFQAMLGGSYMAFVSYDNAKAAKVGAPVYDCYALVILCHKVATIKTVYRDEQIVDFPLFNVRLSRTVRGTMVDMDVTDPKYMGSRVMFVGKPLFF